MSSTKGARDEKSIAQSPQSQGHPQRSMQRHRHPLKKRLSALDTRIALIQALIPLGLDAVAEELQNEVTRLAGAEIHTQRGPKSQSSVGQSTRLGVSRRSKSAPISVPRVRNVVTDEEASLQTYHHLQHPRHMDEGLLLRMIKGIATRVLSRMCRERYRRPLGYLHPPCRDALSRRRHKS